MNIYTTSGSLQYLWGAHILKVGGDLTRRQVNETQSQEPRVGYTFTTAFTADPNNTGGTGNVMASLLMGYPALTTRQKFLIHPGYRMLEAGLFLQDDWRVNNWLTLNPGIRWDYYSPTKERNGLAPNFDFSTLKLVFPGQNGVSSTGNVRSDWNNISPRMGFAAQMGKQTVVRGGFGMNYTPLLQGTFGAFRNPPYTSTLTIQPTNITPINRLSDPVPLPVANDPVNLAGPIYVTAFGYKIPYVLQYNLTVQRQLPLGLVWSTAYAASLGRQQSGSNAAWDQNGAPPGSLPVQQRRTYYSVYPNLTNVNLVTNVYNSSYHSMQMTLAVRERYGMTASMNYTWAHSIDACGGGGPCASLKYYAIGVFKAEKMNSVNDIRHRVAFTWNWALPYGQGSKSILSRLVKNWKLNALGYWQTSVPLSVTQTGSQTNGATGTNYAGVVGDWHVANQTMAQWFNPAAFAAQPNYVWSNGVGNFLRGPNRWNVDAGLAREFPIREKYRIQFRLESFDLTNSVIPNNPVTVLGQPGFGSILTVSGNRQSQVALKLLF